MTLFQFIDDSMGIFQDRASQGATHFGADPTRRRPDERKQIIRTHELIHPQDNRFGFWIKRLSD
jgi:hypothetical protein